VDKGSISWHLIVFSYIIATSASAFEIHEAIKAKNPEEAKQQIIRKATQWQWREKQEGKPSPLNHILDGMAPIHLAAKYNFLDVIETLIAQGADTNILATTKEFPKESAATIALKKYHEGILGLLLESGAEFESESLFNHLQTGSLYNTRGLEKDADFFASLTMAIDDEKSRSLLIYIYPLFATDEEFLDILIKKLEKNKNADWQVSEILKDMADEGFPNGLPSLATTKKIASLLDILKNSKLRAKVWVALKKATDKFQRQLKSTGTSHKERLDQASFLVLAGKLCSLKKLWESIDAKTLARALTTRDSRFFRSISLKQWRLFSKRQEMATDIQKFARLQENAVNFFAYLIVSEKSEDKLQAYTHKLMSMGQEFYDLNNFWGLNQIVIVFSKPEVKRLICLEKNASYQLESFVELLNPAHNYKNYYQRLSELDLKKPCLVILSSLLHYLAHELEQRPVKLNPNDMSDKIIPSSLIPWFINIGTLSRQFEEFKGRAHYKISSEQDTVVHKSALEFFDTLPALPADILEEFSILRKPWDTISNSEHRKVPENKINEWSCRELYSFLHSLPDMQSKKISRELFIEQVLERGVWDGKQLMAFLSDAKNESLYPELYKELDMIKELMPGE